MKRGINIMVLLFILYVVLASSGLVLFKLGATNQSLHIEIFKQTISFSWKTIIGLCCYGLSFILWMYIVSKSDLTVAMPLSVALVNTLVVVESCILLGEKMNFMKGIGIFLIIFGVVLMLYKK